MWLIETVAAESFPESAPESAPDAMQRFCDMAIKLTPEMTKGTVEEVVFENVIWSNNVDDLKATIAMLRCLADTMDNGVKYLAQVDAETDGQQPELQILAEAADM